MTGDRALRPASLLLVIGTVIALAAGLLHPGMEPANDHAKAFAEYARHAQWTAVHLGQFAGMAIVLAGVLGVFVTEDGRSTRPNWVARCGILSAAIALALYGVLQAVDGVALKQAVNSWAAAPEADKASRFASAEAIRWLEWGVRSYHSIMLGVTFLLLAHVTAHMERTPVAMPYLIALSGLAYLAQGWILGVEGFSTANSIPTLAGIATVLVWTVWLAITAWRPARETAHGG